MKKNKLLYVLMLGIITTISSHVFAGDDAYAQIRVYCDYMKDASGNKVENDQGNTGYGLYTKTNHNWETSPTTEGRNTLVVYCARAAWIYRVWAVGNGITNNSATLYLGWNKKDETKCNFDAWMPMPEEYNGKQEARPIPIMPISDEIEESGDPRVKHDTYCKRDDQWIYPGNNGHTLHVTADTWYTGWRNYKYHMTMKICNDEDVSCSDAVLFVFKDNNYSSYSFVENKAKKASKLLGSSIITQLNGGNSFQIEQLAATLNANDGKAYFFLKNGTYSSYDITKKIMDAGYPHKISDDFNGITPEQAKSITAIIGYDDDRKAYFFLNDGTYLSYDLVNNTVEAGYPRQISNSFVGVSNSDVSNMIAVAHDQKGNLLFILKDGNYLIYDVKQKVVTKRHLLSNDFPGISAAQAKNISTVYQF